MTNNQKLLTYFVKKHNTPTVTVLMKLCYLTDLISFKENHKRITDYKYIRYTFGPFTRNIYTDLESLVKEDVLASKIEYGKFGQDTESVIYSLSENAPSVELEEDTKAIVDELLDKLGGHGAHALTNIAYKTKPMVALGATLGGNEHIGEELNLGA